MHAGMRAAAGVAEELRHFRQVIKNLQKQDAID
jgi:hypothetical protein